MNPNSGRVCRDSFSKAIINSDSVGLAAAKLRKTKAEQNTRHYRDLEGRINILESQVNLLRGALQKLMEKQS